MGLFDELGVVEETGDEPVEEEAMVAEGPAPEADDALEQQLREAEARFREIDYYRSLTTASLFGAPGTDPIADRVQKRLVHFARQEMTAILSGETSAPEPKPQLQALSALTVEQVSVLQAFLTNLTLGEVDVLRGFLTRVISDPKALRAIVAPQAPRPTAAVRPVAPAVPAPRPTIPRPTRLPIVPSVGRGPQRPAARLSVTTARPPARPAARPQADEDPMAPSAPASERGGPTRSKHTKIRSPHSKPFGDVERRTEELSRGATDVRVVARRMSEDAKEAMEMNEQKAERGT